MNRELWPHQVQALDALKLSIAQGVKRIVLQSPTGSGKSMIAAAITEGAIRKKNPMAFVVSQISLVDQTVEAFYAEGVRDIGVIQANHSMTDWSKPVQVCSIQTLKSRGAFPKAKVVVFDEVHILHDHHKKWLADPEWATVPFIGLSATPWTKGLGKYFDSLLVVATTQELIDKGMLSKFRVFAAGHPDLAGVKIVAGDYQENQLSEAMQKGSLTADIINTWKTRWGKDKTFVFAVDCAHAQALQARFQSAGINAAYQDAKTSSAERADIKRKFHNGEYPVICNVGTLTIGVDYDVRCLVLARPTKSEMLYTQIIGRALRTAPNKDYAIILDHSDTTQNLGFVTDIHHEQLDMGRTQPPAEHRKATPKPCPQCDCMLPRQKGVCPNCGFTMQVQVSGLIEKDGELYEITDEGRKVATKKKKQYEKPEATMAEKRDFFGQLRYLAHSKGYKEGWAAQKYRSKFDAWPRGMDDVGFKPPDPSTLSWIRHEQIKWAKSKHNPRSRSGHTAAVAR